MCAYCFVVVVGGVLVVGYKYASKRNLDVIFMCACLRESIIFYKCIKPHLLCISSAHAKYLIINEVFFFI